MKYVWVVLFAISAFLTLQVFSVGVFFLWRHHQEWVYFIIGSGMGLAFCLYFIKKIKDSEKNS